MAEFIVHQFPCLSDNYGLLVHDPATGDTASIDTPEAGPIMGALAEKGWTLTHILNTHHHGDHTGGNMALKDATGCKIIGPHGGGIPGIDEAVAEGDIVKFGSFTAKVIETPGHTLDHIIFWFEDQNTAFVGDTLFALGCGRVFEGTFDQMWASIAKVKALPPETIIYCAHEYTAANANFSLSVDPDNEALKARAKKIAALRDAGKPTVPTILSVELATNPFLRPDDLGVQKAVGLVGASNSEVFAEIRRRKDNF